MTTAFKAESRNVAAKRVDSAAMPDTGSAEMFISFLGGVVLSDPMRHRFEGVLSRESILWFWKWVIRDILPDLEQRVRSMVADGLTPEGAMEKLLPEIFSACTGVLKSANRDPDTDRRLTVQMGGDKVRDSLPAILSVLRYRPLIAKAQAFGRAASQSDDERTLAGGLHALRNGQPESFAYLMQAMVGQMAVPARMSKAVINLSDGANESDIRSAGYAPVVDAFLAHAQEQLNLIATMVGAFADIDLVCCAIARFHRLLRAVTAYVDMPKQSHWAHVAANLTRHLSVLLEPQIRDIGASVTQSLRQRRNGEDRVDAEQLLAALNGLYLMEAIRNARDSLALNAVFEKTWGELGQIIDLLVKRALEDYRANPVPGPVRERLEAGIKMAEIRFNAEYANVIRRAFDAAQRRSA